MTKAQMKFPRQNKLSGRLRQYDVTYSEIAKVVGKTTSAIESIVNGRGDYKVSIARKIASYLTKKSKETVLISDVLE